jgi:ssDNA-binding Zn-finger/Zn-ribbon topoisomerase 1
MRKLMGMPMRHLRSLWAILALVLTLVLLQLGGAQWAQAQTTDFDHASTGFVLNAQHQYTRCESCHLKGVFKGTPKDCASCHGWSNPRAATVMPTNHIPTANISCEMCHQANMAQFVDATRTFSHAMLGGQTCLACHSSRQPHPNVKSNPVDPTHNAVLARGQSCDQCHNTQQFVGTKVPANHIPTAAVPCSNCHTTTDYRVMPDITTIHANAQSTSSNCQQCHSASAAAAYAMSTMVPALVGTPPNHIGTRGQSCEACHVGANSSIAATPVQSGASFAHSAFNHTGNTASCASCHGPGISSGTFFGVTPKSVSSLSPAHIPYSGACDSCHINSVPAGQIPLGLASSGMTTFAGAKFSHSGITSGCGACHGDSVTASSFYGVVPRNTAQLNPAHIPTTAACETCHVGAIPPGLVSANGADSSTRFSGAAFSHSGISSGCVTCHGPSVGSSTFFGVSSLVVMPSTTPGGHIPSSTSCESCHAGSVPSSLVSVTASHPVPGSAFRNAPPTAAQIHAGTSAVCSSCHEAGQNWLGLDLPLYARVPTSYTGVATTQYRGFQTRPVLGGTSTSVDDGAHPGTLECSNCHGNTIAFTGPVAPANHIPYANAVACSTCHGDFSAAPRVSVIHANIQNTSANCQQCHSTANAALYASSTTINPIKTPPANHISMGSLGCEGCHVGTNSSMASTPVQDGASFAGSLFNHSGATATCAACHGAGVTASTFFGVYPVGLAALTPAHLPSTASCETCHTAGAPTGLVPAAGMASFANAGFSHSGITSGCGACHGDSVTASSFYGVVPRNTAQLNPAHIPTTAACETCHVGAIPPGLVSANGADSSTRFSGAAFSHSGISSGCVTCHGPSVGSSTFFGVSSLVVMPSTTPGGHIPSSTSCESCHAGSVPSSLVSVTASHPVPGSAFRNAPPTAAQIHAGTSAVCSSCHEAGQNWLGLDLPLYARVPTSYTGVATTQYRGFQTRPVLGGTSTSVDDGAHPGTLECSNCHGNTIAFTGPVAPANHIPYANAVACSTCHGDFSAAPRVSVIHANIQNTSANCQQCHSTANAALYASSTTINPIKTPPANHISMGSLGCEGCHVGTNSSMASTPVQDGASFAGSLFNHSGATATCAACHGAGVTASTFFGVYPVGLSVLSPAHVPTTAACQSCHTAGAPTGLVPAAGMTSFANAGFSHSGITSGCVSCHGPSLTNTSFFGVNPLIGMPPSTGATPHIPSSTSCESCHLGSVPSGLVAASSGASVGSSLFRNAPPTAAQIHANTAATCSGCHEAGKAWVGMDLALYARSPSTFTGANSLYKGFNTRPLVSASGYSLADAGHPDQTSGECSLCHGNTVAFSAPSAPANHIPYLSTAVCGDCHAPFGTQPTNAAIHAKLQSPSSNCEQCHSTANAALYASTTTVKPIKTPAGNHIPMGNLGCASCHVGANSSLTLPVGNTATFANSAFSHSGISGGCNNCHGVNVEAGTFDGVTPKSVSGLTSAHIPVANSLGCETCHAGSMPSALVPPTGYSGSPSFAGGQFIHTGISSGCDTCHGPAISASSFKGVSSIVVMPPTSGANAHIPSSTSCENCHLGSVPSGLLSVTASHPMPGSAFLNAPPDTNKIHAGISTGCNACHEATLSWVGMSAYPRTPATLSANPAQLYTGFHTRPGTAAGFSMSDGSHPGIGDCSQCHGDVLAFGAPTKPANHMPYDSTKLCGACHNPFGTSPTITAIHANLQSLSTNCAQCHSTANSAIYSTASRTIKAPGATHVPMRSLGCESCHVGSGSSMASTPVSGTPTFANSAFSHSGMSSNCAECHGPAITGTSFQGISTIVVMPPTSPATSASHFPSSTTCESCHAGSMPATLVPGNAPHAAPNSGFLNAPPVTTQTHAGVSGSCSNCHEKDMAWMGMGAYPTNKTGPNYNGFHTRPYGAVGTYFVNDAVHPVGGDCSTCHSGFTAWSATVLPTNHIPTASVACANCHTTSNFTTMPTLANIHANAPSTSSNCAQCHSAANAAIYNTAAMTIKAPASNHIPMASLGCESCHVGSGSSISATPVPNGALFSNSAFSHTGATASCATCHAGITGSTFEGGLVPVTLTSPVLTPVHVPNPASLDCGACHTAIPTGLSKIGSTSTTFAAGKFSHTGITTGCNACHDSGITGSSFKGITSIVVLPPTTSGASNHIPSPVNAQCEVCHLGSTPSTLLAANATVTTPGSTKFKTPTPTGVMIHTGVSANCNSCHEAPNTWVDVSLYPRVPSVLTANATYTGFHTRPNSPASTNSVLDANHPSSSSGDCSVCHGSTVNFSAVAKPANHIPTSTTAQCQNCHTNLVGADGVYVSSSINFVQTITLANIHAYAPSTTTNCAQCHSTANAATYAIPSISFSIKSPASIANHIPFGATACEVCHVYSGGPLSTPVANGATFAGGKFSHSGFTTGCATCHGAGVGNTTFTGVTAIVAIAASTTTMSPTTHIPYSASCETCHSATVPSGLVSVTSVGTKFATPVAAGTVIHSNSTGFTCKTCHERGYQWLGMTNYPRTPAAINLAVPTTAYNGFQTRPGSAATTYGYIDAGHTGTTLDTGDCSQCHGSTTAFTGEGKPSGHMPTTVATCSTCHISSTGDYSVAALASLPVLHTGITSGSTVPATTANMISKTCGTCHTVGSGGTSGTAPFAGCLTEATAAACPTPPPITWQPTTTGLHPTHVPTGTTTALTVDCNGCHASVSSFAGVNMKNSAMHTSVNGVAKVQCMSCHERGLSFYGVASLKVRPSGHHTGQDCGNSGCHTYSGGFRALVKPVMRGALVNPDMSRIRPTIPAGKPSRGSLGNSFDHKGVVAGQCKSCHDGKSASGMPARHLMVATSCDSCHRPTTWLPAQFNHSGITPNTCLACHNGLGASAKPAGHFMTARSCDSCHKTMGWTPVNYQHVSPLYVVSPDKLSCVSCHDTNGEIIRRQARSLTRTKPILVGP